MEGWGKLERIGNEDLCHTVSHRQDSDERISEMTDADENHYHFPEGVGGAKRGVATESIPTFSRGYNF